MVDTIKLEYYIKKSGHTNRECAAVLGITLQTFLNKINNRSEFKYSEILKLAEFIDLDVTDKVFFAQEVEPNSTLEKGE